MLKYLPIYRILLVFLTIGVLNNRFHFQELVDQANIKGLTISKPSWQLAVNLPRFDLAFKSLLVTDERLAPPTQEEVLISYNLEKPADEDFSADLESEWREDPPVVLAANIYRPPVLGNVGVATKKTVAPTTTKPAAAPVNTTTPIAQTSTSSAPSTNTPSGGVSSSPEPSPSPSTSSQPSPSPEPPKEEKANKGQEKKEERSGKPDDKGKN